MRRGTRTASSDRRICHAHRLCAKDAQLRAGDSLIFFNFRPDRARELTRALVDPDFSGFARRDGCFPLYYVCMTQYDATMPNVHVAFCSQGADQ